MPCPPVEVRQVERDALANATASPFGSRSFRLSARRRIPSAHFPVKEYSSDSSPVSKMSHKDETLPSLRDRPWKLLNSGILSVKHSPTHAEASGGSREESGLLPSSSWDGDPPSGEQRQEGGKIASGTARKYSGDIFPDHPAGACAKSQSCKLKREAASVILESFPQPRDAERLARRSANEQVDIPLVVLGHDLGEVAEVRYVREPLGEDGGGEPLYLRHEGAMPSERPPCDGGSLDAAAYASVSHFVSFASWFKSVRPFGRLRGRTHPAAVKKQQEPRRRLGDTRLLGARGCLLPRLAFFQLKFSAQAAMRHPRMFIAALQNFPV